MQWQDRWAERVGVDRDRRERWQLAAAAHKARTRANWLGRSLGGGKAGTVDGLSALFFLGSARGGTSSVRKVCVVRFTSSCERHTAARLRGIGGG